MAGLVLVYGHREEVTLMAVEHHMGWAPADICDGRVVVLHPGSHDHVSVQSVHLPLSTHIVPQHSLPGLHGQLSSWTGGNRDC